MNEKTDKEITTEISYLITLKNYALLSNYMHPYRCNATAVDTQHIIRINSVQKIFID